MLSLDEIRKLDFRFLKFVQLDNGTPEGSFAFCFVAPYGKSHKELAAGRAVRGAGTLYVREPGDWTLEDDFSRSLNIGCSTKTRLALEKCLGSEVKPRYGEWLDKGEAK